MLSKILNIHRQVHNPINKDLTLASVVGLAFLTLTIVLLNAGHTDFPKSWHVPVNDGINAGEKWFQQNLSWLTRSLRHPIEFAMTQLTALLLWLPWPFIPLTTALVAFRLSGLRLSLFCFGTFLCIGVLDMWEPALTTLALLIVSVSLAVVIGVTLGILASQSARIDAALRPLLDVMQTVPSFVYLIPAIVFIGIGSPPAIVATVIYALPPAVRLTRLGILQVSPEAVEAAKSFGSTPLQALWKVKLPLALPSILLGVNQTIMMALAMVIIAAFIGAAGLGLEVWNGLRRINVGWALEAGLSVVLLAIVFDRISYAYAQDSPSRGPGNGETYSLFRRYWFFVAGLFVLLALIVVDQLLVNFSEFPSSWRFALREPINDGVDWIKVNSFVVLLTGKLRDNLYLYGLGPVTDFLKWLPWPVFVLAVAGVAWITRGWRLSLFSVACLLFIGVVGMWDDSMETLGVVIVSVALCAILGIPLGILASRSNVFEAVVRVVLDFMQTMPSLVYLIPVLMLFGANVVSGLIATVIYAVPPIIRLTNLGIREVSPDAVEAARAFGSTDFQLLRKVQLPLALPSIMLGLNQAIMMSVGMVIITALIGAGGLGLQVYRAVVRLDTGFGFEVALSIVFLAIIMDRVTEAQSVRELHAPAAR